MSTTNYHRSRLSNALRKWCDIHGGTYVGTYVDKDDCDELRAIANHIDSWLFELPRDMDGVPIHIGDTVYLDGGDRKSTVNRIGLGISERGTFCIVYGKDFSSVPEHISHVPGDDLESIANDLDNTIDDMVDQECTSLSDISILRDFVDRIRKLAELREDQ